MDSKLSINNSHLQSNYGCDCIAGLYNIGNTIGRGHFAVVKEAKHVFTEEKVAIKIIDKTKLDNQAREHLYSEVMCMKLVQHPNVVRLYEVIDTANKLYLVLEHGDGGDLYDYIMKYENGLPEIEAKKYFRQILHAIMYCHNLHVVHRDLKPENVVFFEKWELVKLTDFGFSNKFTPGQMLKTSCGSLAYSAPEILLGDDYDAPKVDIWSLGVLMYMLVCGKLPFNEPNDSETLSHIMDCKYDFPSGISSSCRALIRKMLVKEAANRASLDEIVNDKWLEQSSCENRLVEDTCLPLITLDRLTMEEHLEILNKMSEGGLASVDEIQRVLDLNEYSYISATFFLLAERKLKRRYLEKYLKRQFTEMEANITDGYEEEDSAATNSSISSVQEAGEERFRRFSMILEDEEDEEEVEEMNAVYALVSVREELESDSVVCQDKVAASNLSLKNSRTSDSVADKVESDHSIMNFSNYRYQYHLKYRCKSAIYSNMSRFHFSDSLSSIPHSTSANQDDYNCNAVTNNNFLKALAIGKSKTLTAKFQWNPLMLFSRRASSIFSTAESPLDDNFPYLCRLRPSLPTIQLQLLTSKRRSFPVLSYLYSTGMSQSISDMSADSESRKLSFNKITRHIQLPQSRLNSTSTCTNDNLRRLRLRSSSSRPNSLGAPMSMSAEELQQLIANAVAKDQSVDTAWATVAEGHSPTVTGLTMHRDICAPIHEEEELTRSRDVGTTGTPDVGGIPQLGDGKRSPDATVKPQKRYKHHPKCLSNQQLAQSSVSLRSFASSLRDSRVMMSVIRGAIELQTRGSSQSRSRTAGTNNLVRGQPCRNAYQCRSQVSASTSVSQRESQNCDFLAASFTSLPERDIQKLSLPCPCTIDKHHSLTRQQHTAQCKIQSTEPSPKGLMSEASSSGKQNFLLRASNTVNRKTRFIVSCCTTT